MGDTNYESFYNGGISSLDPSHGDFIPGQHVSSSYLGFPGSTQTANQLKESINAIKQGVKAFEVTMGVADTAEQIPVQNFEEMRALMKISGVRPSVHAPFTIDPAGFEQKGGYSDENRVEVERRLFGVLEKAKQLNSDGNVPVVFHSSGGVPGAQYRPGDESKGEERFHATKIILMDRETGQLATDLKEERKFYPDRVEDFKDKGTLHGTHDEIDSANASKWNQTLSSLAQLKKMSDEVIGKNPAFIAEYKNISIAKLPEIYDSMEDVQKHAYNQLQDANIFLKNAHLNFNSAFNTAYKYGDENQKKILHKIAEEFSSDLKKNRGKVGEILDHRNALDKAIRGLGEITTGVYKDPKTGEIVSMVPKVLVPVEEFAKEKAAETFGNLAWRSYDELSKRDASKAPIIAIENMFPGMAFSRAEDLKGLVEASQKKFVDNAVGKGMDKKDAEKAAKKLIGVTWDVGHLNIMKKEGFTDKDVIKSTETIAPYVKHVHLTDNFGYSDSHLAPGMGNVPMKKILEKLEKEGRLDEMSKIIEAPGFVQHFQRSPHGWTMAALGSPIYGAMMGPYWNQVSGVAAGGGYFGAPFAYMPEKHFSTYGSNFSSLPMEVGGQMPGTASRFSGTPNA